LSKQLLLVLIALALPLAEQVRAWDHDRAGMQLGFGVGGGYAGMRQTMSFQDNIGNETQLDKVAFCARVEFGYAPNRRWLISLVSSSATAHNSVEPQILAALGSNVTFGIACPEVRYYLAERAPSFFVGGGAGMAYYTEVLSLFGSKGSTGPGFILTAGYEFASHFSVVVDCIVGRPRKAWENEERKDNFMVVGAMVRWSGY
jgi:hypothetical protein